MFNPCVAHHFSFDTRDRSMLSFHLIKNSIDVFYELNGALKENQNFQKFAPLSTSPSGITKKEDLK